MKLVVRTMGTFLVAAVALTLIIALISYTLIPELSLYISNTFPSEKNLELASTFAPDPDPEHAVPDDGSVYETTDYVYTYDADLGGWGVTVKDKTKSQYEALNEIIYNVPVVSMCETFKDCTSLVQSPSIPKSVTDMTSAFDGCSSLTGVISVYAEPGSYADCFVGTIKPIELAGSSTLLYALKDTSSNGNISVAE